MEETTKNIEKNEIHEQIIDEKINHHEATLANHEARLNNLENKEK